MDWRDPILSHFTSALAAVSRLTVVADPDDLLTEPGLIERVHSQGFEILQFNDHAAFRLAYEQRFRQVWDAGASTNLVVLLRASRAQLDGLPFDLLEDAKRTSRLLSFSLAELFPALQPHVVAELERVDLDAVFAALAVHRPEPLGANATRDFLLRHVFKVAPELINSPADLLRVLLKRHYSARVFPPTLDEHFIRLLRSNASWSEWPLEQIVPNRGQFFAFLQERWPLFVRRNVDRASDIVVEAQPAYGLRLAGPAMLPFDHEDVRVYIDNLFAEGVLVPTSVVPKAHVRESWIASGVGGEQGTDAVDRVRRLLALFEREFPGSDADHHQWIQLAQRWAEVQALRWAHPSAFPETLRDGCDEMHARIERGFEQWLESKYGLLPSLSPWPQPVMVHHLPEYLARGIDADGGASRALVIVDGMAMDQWAAVRAQFPASEWMVEEGGLFAWIPTLTSVSRQSIFAAGPPFYFAASIETTRKEESQWLRFWEDRGLRKSEVAYFCQKDLEPDEDLLARVRQRVESSRCRALAIVVGTVDQMIHGTITGTDGLHASVRHWADRRALVQLVELLMAADFEVTIAADHGNVEARGMGKPDVGATAEQRGERVHVFRDGALRSKTAAEYPGSIEWAGAGLPEDYVPLIAPALRAFVTDGKRTVAHGGACIEEVIVPFIRISRPT